MEVLGCNLKKKRSFFLKLGTVFRTCGNKIDYVFICLKIQKSSLVLAEETHITKGVLVAKGEISGLRRLRIDEDGIFDMFPEASFNTQTPSSIRLDSLHVFAGGSFHQSLGDLPVGRLNVTLSDDFVVNAYGSVNVSHIALQAKTIRLDTSSLLTAHGRGYGSTRGPGAGVSSLNGGSGGGHGGTGGRGDQIRVGVAYDSVTNPSEYGSGGGRGSQDLVGVRWAVMSIICTIMFI